MQQAKLSFEKRLDGRVHVNRGEFLIGTITGITVWSFAPRSCTEPCFSADELLQIRDYMQMCEMNTATIMSKLGDHKYEEGYEYYGPGPEPAKSPDQNHKVDVPKYATGSRFYWEDDEKIVLKTITGSNADGYFRYGYFRYGWGQDNYAWASEEDLDGAIFVTLGHKVKEQWKEGDLFLFNKMDTHVKKVIDCRDSTTGELLESVDYQDLQDGDYDAMTFGELEQCLFLRPIEKKSAQAERSQRSQRSQRTTNTRKTPVASWR